MTTSPNEPGQLRIGDAERQAVAEHIATAHARGQLEPDEFQERVEKAHSAKYQAELDALVSDLPAAPSPVAKAWKSARRSDQLKAARQIVSSVPRRIWIIAISALAALGLLGAVIGLVSGGGGDDDGPRGGRLRGDDVAERMGEHAGGGHAIGAFFGGAFSMVAFAALVIGAFFVVRRIRNRRKTSVA